jgi:hypothetical protein
MPPLPRIGIACPLPGERAILLEWLDAGGYEPVPMLDLSALASTLETRPMEALVADASLVSETSLPGVIRTLGINRPLILVGDPANAPAGMLRSAAWLDRPVANDPLMMAIALALAEGRPVRRSARKYITPLGALVDGAAARVLDVSDEGVRLELSGGRPVALPPLFTVRVPAFGVVTTVKRVWVAQSTPRSVLCGGIIVGTSPQAVNGWRRLVDAAPTLKGGMSIEAMNFK